MSGSGLEPVNAPPIMAFLHVARQLLYLRNIPSQSTTWDAFMATARQDERAKAGFTILELLIVIAIAMLMSGIAFPIWSSLQHRLDARSAQGVFVSMQRRARVLALERGETVRLNVSFPGDSVWITSSAGTEESMSLLREFNADMAPASGSDTGEQWICMGARGFAVRTCNSFTGAQEVVFTVGAHEERVRVLPLGQVEAL